MQTSRKGIVIATAVRNESATVPLVFSCASQLRTDLLTPSRGGLLSCDDSRLSIERLSGSPLKLCAVLAASAGIMLDEMVPAAHRDSAAEAASAHGEVATGQAGRASEYGVSGAWGSSEQQSDVCFEGGKEEFGWQRRKMRARRGRNILQELGCGRGAAVLLFMGLAALLLGSALSIECWIGTYDVFKRPDCDTMYSHSVHSLLYQSNCCSALCCCQVSPGAAVAAGGGTRQSGMIAVFTVGRTTVRH